MVAPVSGPFNYPSHINIDDAGSRYWVRDRYKQKPPYDLALPYGNVHIVTLSLKRTKTGGESLINTAGLANANTGKSPDWSGLQPSTPWLGTINREWIHLENHALMKFRDSISTTAELAVALAERQQSMDMIKHRGLQLLGAALALRKKGPVGLIKALKGSITPEIRKDQKRWRKSSHQFANWWLEYSFGWKPLVFDIWNACDVLSDPVPPSRVEVRVGRRVRHSGGVNETSYNYDNVRKGSISGVMRVKVGATLVVTNPNLFLASKLGLTNPATVAWELVPFSFVVDWFVNVSDFLGNFSEMHGIRYDNPFYNFGFSATSDYSHDRTWKQFESPPPRWTILGTSHLRCQMRGFWFRRYNFIPSVTLGVRAPWTLKANRAANAISLLIQKGFAR